MEVHDLEPGRFDLQPQPFQDGLDATRPLTNLHATESNIDAGQRPSSHGSPLSMLVGRRNYAEFVALGRLEYNFVRRSLDGQGRRTLGSRRHQFRGCLDPSRYPSRRHRNSNLAGRFNDSDSEPLAAVCSDAFAEIIFDATVYGSAHVSPARRRQETARGLGLTAWRDDARVRERDFGVFQGARPASARSTPPTPLRSSAPSIPTLPFPAAAAGPNTWCE